MTAPNRSLDGRFKRGRSGNPGGRPKTLARVQDLARQYSETSIKVLGEIMEDEDERGATRIAAIQVLLDRGWGKPLQRIDTGKTDIEDMTDAELEAHIAELEAQQPEFAEAFRMARKSVAAKKYGTSHDRKTRH